MSLICAFIFFSQVSKHSDITAAFGERQRELYHHSHQWLSHGSLLLYPQSER